MNTKVRDKKSLTIRRWAIIKLLSYHIQIFWRKPWKETKDKEIKEENKCSECGEELASREKSPVLTPYRRNGDGDSATRRGGNAWRMAMI